MFNKNESLKRKENVAFHLPTKEPDKTVHRTNFKQEFQKVNFSLMILQILQVTVNIHIFHYFI